MSRKVKYICLFIFLCRGALIKVTFVKSIAAIFISYNYIYFLATNCCTEFNTSFAIFRWRTTRKGHISFVERKLFYKPLLQQTNKTEMERKFTIGTTIYQVVKKKQDRSRRCQYIQSIDLLFFCVFFSILTCFATLTGNDASNRLNIIIFVISRSILVGIDTSLALLPFFCVHFELFF